MTMWVDYFGRRWPVSSTRARLKPAKNAGHAALRLYCHTRDAFTCLGCAAKVESVPPAWDGRWALGVGPTNSPALVLDHIVPVRAGGSNHPDNLQTLCYTCNRRVTVIDRHFPTILAARS